MNKAVLSVEEEVLLEQKVEEETDAMVAAAKKEEADGKPSLAVRYIVRDKKTKWCLGAYETPLITNKRSRSSALENALRRLRDHPSMLEWVKRGDVEIWLEVVEYCPPSSSVAEPRLLIEYK